MQSKTIYLAAAIALSLASSAASAESWTYRGTLDDGGQPANGNYDLRVSLLSEDQNASVASPITFHAVAVENGQFAVDVDFGIDLANAPVMHLLTEVQQGSSGFAALGEPTRFDPKAALGSVCWDTTGNAGTSPGINFLGTTDAQPFVLRTRNVRSLLIEPSSILSGAAPITANVFAGAQNLRNGSVRGATISGGGVTGDDPEFTNEDINYVTSHYTAIGGGYANTAGGFGLLAGALATVGGGGENLARGLASTVGAGKGNSALGDFSTASGGLSNIANGANSTVGGGATNTARGLLSTVGGGSSNDASGIWSTISGGAVNCAGGDYSWAGGLRAKVRPGNEPGDGTCVANSGDANGDEGTFVWAGSQNSEFISTGADQFLVRASGGVGVNTNTIPPLIDMVLQNRPGANGNVDFYMRTANHGRGINIAMTPSGAAAGMIIAQFDGTTFTDRIMLQADGDFLVTAAAYKPGGGSWASSSDSRLKTDVTPLAGALDRLLQLRPVEFTYIKPDPAKRPAGRHIGFIAQEVAEVFPAWVETDEDGYLTVGSQGFEALTVDSLRELRNENATLKASHDALEARLAAIEQQR